MTAGFQPVALGPPAYERHLVPVFFAPCAELLLDLAGIEPGERVLDVACGTGIVARRASARAGARGAVVGVDANVAMIDYARTLAPVIEWHVADAAALPLPDADVDVVCCQQGLQFFADPPAALAEMHRVLAPGGRLVLAVWRAIEHHPVFAAFTEALRTHMDDDAATTMLAPFTGPDRVRLRRLLADAGLAHPHVRIGIIPARFPSPREFVHHEVASTQLAAPFATLAETRRQALIDHTERSLHPYLDDDGLAFPIQTWLITAKSPNRE